MIEHHIISPHRDDGYLTFGGFINGRVAAGEKVTMHVIYGMDGYVRDEFREELLRTGTEHPHIKRLREICPQVSSDPHVDQIKTLVQGRQIDSDQTLSLGIAVRSLEDLAVATMAGYNLVNYDFRCGYPLRGYPRFNSVLKESDTQTQLAVQFGEVEASDDLAFAERLGAINPNITSFYDRIKSNASTDTDINLYFPSGIGGHPDHVLMCMVGQRIREEGNPRINVSFGQDLPYTSVPEWIARSPLPLHEMDKVVVDISDHKNKKLELLRLYHSQFTEEDLRLAAIYPEMTFQLLSRDFPLVGFDAEKAKNMSAVEIQYR